MAAQVQRSASKTDAGADLLRAPAGRSKLLPLRAVTSLPLATLLLLLSVHFAGRR